MEYFWGSVRTWSYWRYALFSASAASRILVILGGLWSLIELLDFFGMYTRDKYSPYAFFVLLAVSICVAVSTRRPKTRISYRIPGRDLTCSVQIGDLLEANARNLVISTNTTFDTDIGSGLISPESVQGKFTFKFFAGKSSELDIQIDESLQGRKSEYRSGGKGKNRKFPIGTVAKVDAHGKTFYLLAMSELNEDGNASTNPTMIDEALDGLWAFIAERGELGDIAMAIIGTGRGRVKLSRKKMIERIVQSFVDASNKKIFANQLVVYLHPKDAENFSVNLFEVRDYIAQSLHL